MQENTKSVVKRRKRRPNLKHGAYKYLSKANLYSMPVIGLASCNSCPLQDHCDYYTKDASCAILDGYTPKRFNEIMAMEQVLPEQKGIAWQVIKYECWSFLIDAYLSIHGIFQETEKGIDVQPILKAYNSYQNSLRLAYRELGLTPASLKDAMSLQKDGRGLAASIQAAEEAEVID